MKLNWKSAETRARFKEAIWVIAGRMPSAILVDAYLDSDSVSLQEFCIEYMPATWMTGIGIIDAAYLLVDEAFANANIDEEGNIR
jgi:hypothetical protein